jgi:uncharacterized protein (DUF58 family)
MKAMGEYPGFGLRITRWGTIFLVAVVIVALAAVNTGNNSLMVLFGMALGCYVVSGVWSRQVLGRVRAAAVPKDEVFAGRPAPVQVELRNTSRLFPAYGLVLRDAERRLLLVEPHVPAGGTCTRTVEVMFTERGRQPLGPWRLEVLLPLGFFLKSKEVARGAEVLVYPRLATTGLAPELYDGAEQLVERLAGRGRSGEVTQLRGFRDGDELRHIHWKQTARQRRLVVAERQRYERAAAMVVVDNRLRDPGDRRQRVELELRISRAATTVVRHLARGQAIGLVAGGVVIEPQSRLARLGALLRPLAELEPAPLDAGPCDDARDVVRPPGAEWPEIGATEPAPAPVACVDGTSASGPARRGSGEARREIA